MPSSSSRGSGPTPQRSSNSTLSYMELCTAYGLDEDCCHRASNSMPQSKKCRHRINCLHGLRGKGKGIWDVRPPALRALGPDPNLRKREPGTLVGLTNLGATWYVVAAPFCIAVTRRAAADCCAVLLCAVLSYMNTLLQCLFMNSTFRHTLYRFRSSSPLAFHSPALRHSSSSSSHFPPLPPSSSSSSHPDAVVLLLQELFGLLEYGPSSSQNPVHIARELGLNAHEQQDINEFNNLFLSHLELRLRTCDVSAADPAEVQRIRTLVASEFNGEMVSSVTCLTCGTESARKSSFLDVTLLIKGKKTVQQCLQGLTEEEQLGQVGRSDNRYFLRSMR